MEGALLGKVSGDCWGWWAVLPALFVQLCEKRGEGRGDNKGASSK